ncbi:unnamed protein product [Linum trigynum]|uniref:Uncharacterized protein n=1 Tax=Linum trigynum TaxID=586398 RepID=A0AAV2E3W8_9ROSI
MGKAKQKTTQPSASPAKVKATYRRRRQTQERDTPPKRQRKNNQGRARQPSPPPQTEAQLGGGGLHGFLQLPDKHRRALECFLPLPFGQQRCIDWDLLERLGAADPVRTCLRLPAWCEVLSINEVIYRELTIEFLSTLSIKFMCEFHLDKPEDNITFRLGGQARQMSITEFREALQIYPPGFLTTGHGLISEKVYSPRAQLVDAMWKRVKQNHVDKSDTAHYKGNDLLPPWRIIHNIIAHSVAAREGSPGSVTKRDLNFFLSMVKDPPIHLGLVILKTLQKMTSNKQIKTIHGGAYITRLARHFGIDPVGSHCTIAQSTQPISQKNLADLYLLSKVNVPTNTFLFTVNAKTELVGIQTI